jgi:toxin CptA
MPKAPTALGIVPSRLSLLLHALLAAAVVGVGLLYAPLWLGVAILLAMLGVLLLTACRRPRGELRALPLPDDGLRWEWRDVPDRPWRAVSLDCDYLGPWLIGLRLDGRRLWLWPDSGDPDALWRLRRVLVQRRAP